MRHLVDIHIDIHHLIACTKQLFFTVSLVAQTGRTREGEFNFVRALIPDFPGSSYGSPRTGNESGVVVWPTWLDVYGVFRNVSTHAYRSRADIHVLCDGSRHARFYRWNYILRAAVQLLPIWKGPDDGDAGF